MLNILKKSFVLLIISFSFMITSLSFAASDDIYYQGDKVFNASHAEKGRGNFNISLFSHYTSVNDADNDAVLAGARITYDIFKYLEFGVEGGWQRWEVTDEDNVKFGDLDDIPVLGIVIFKYPIEINATQKIIPYVFR